MPCARREARRNELCIQLRRRALGEDHVGFGSDFDGATVPAEIGSAAGLPALVGSLRQSGYSEPLLEKLGTTNWLNVLERTIG